MVVWTRNADPSLFFPASKNVTHLTVSFDCRMPINLSFLLEKKSAILSFNKTHLGIEGRLDSKENLWNGFLFVAWNNWCCQDNQQVWGALLQDLTVSLKGSIVQETLWTWSNNSKSVSLSLSIELLKVWKDINHIYSLWLILMTNIERVFFLLTRNENRSAWRSQECLKEQESGFFRVSTDSLCR